jgi:hypothetical protein
VKLYVLASILITVILLFSFTDGTKKETPINNYLFKIDRSKDANIVMYNLNLNDSGHLNSNKPITIYWIKNSKKGNIEPLTWIQKKYAYGLKYTAITEDFATFKFVSYDKLTFTLKKVEEKFNVYTKFDDRLVKLNRIYVQIDGGTFWIPNVTEVKIIATEVKTGKETIKTIYP